MRREAEQPAARTKLHDALGEFITQARFVKTSGLSS